MANKNTQKKVSIASLFVIGLLTLVLGIVASFGTLTYINLPLTDAAVITEEVFYSKSSNSENTSISVENAQMSVHFLELGNKYTGDCTYIKTDECDILIDCGSKANSVGYVADYLNQYITDGKIEYVIITHAHQDHYAGFATSENVSSIFDLYQCENIITFSRTNQSIANKTYNNYLRELADEVEAGANHYTALECIEQSNGAQTTYNIGTNATMTILNSYYYDHDATTENDYSVCTLFTCGDDNILLTGDLEKGGEEKLVELNPTLPTVKLYKAGHHGSKTSSSNALLSVIQPEVVCVCCCAGSPEYTKTQNNQFPTQEFINNIAEYTQKVYITTLCVDYDKNEFTSFNGNIVCLFNSSGYNVVCSNNDTKLKDSEWFKNNRTCPASWQ